MLCLLIVGVANNGALLLAKDSKKEAAKKITAALKDLKKIKNKAKKKGKAKKKKKQKKKRRKKKKKKRKKKKKGKRKKRKKKRKKEIVKLGGDGSGKPKEQEGVPAVIKAKKGRWYFIKPGADSKLQIHRVALGKDFNTIWGVDKVNKDLYKLESTGWKLQIKAVANNVFVGGDNTVVAVDANRKGAMLVDGEWKPFGGDRKFARMAIISKDEMWATYKKDEKTYEIWHYKDMEWQQAKNDDGENAFGFYEMDANTGLIGLGPKGGVWAKGLDAKAKLPEGAKEGDADKAAKSDKSDDEKGEEKEA